MPMQQGGNAMGGGMMPPDPMQMLQQLFGGMGGGGGMGGMMPNPLGSTMAQGNSTTGGQKGGQQPQATQGTGMQPPRGWNL